MEMAERLSLIEMDERLPGNYSKEVWIKNVFEAWEKKNGSMKGKLDEVWCILILCYLSYASNFSICSPIKSFSFVQYRHAVELERISLWLAQGNLKDAEAGAFG